MKFIPALLILLAGMCPVSAQLNPLPASSLDDGVSIHAFSPSLEPHWASSDLAHYHLGADNPFPQPSSGWVDPYGVRWTDDAPSKTTFNAAGGTFRFIALGGAGDWLNAVGYAYSGDPTDGSAYTLARSDGSISPSLLQFGDCGDISIAPGDAATFDFWINTARGAYTLFNPLFSVSDQGSAQIFWTETPLQVSTYLPGYDTTVALDTWIVSLVETPAAGDDAPHEFRFALQEVTASGVALLNQAVPEPATFGIWASAILGAMIALRRRRRF